MKPPSKAYKHVLSQTCCKSCSLIIAAGSSGLREETAPNVEPVPVWADPED